jgi:hypothetical protein
MLPVPDFFKDPFLLYLLFELTHCRFEGFPLANFDLRQSNQLLSNFMVFEQFNITFIPRDVNEKRGNSEKLGDVSIVSLRVIAGKTKETSPSTLPESGSESMYLA